MHILIVFAHPEPRSYNGALKDAAAATLRKAGHSVQISDLYGEGFDPVEKPGHFVNRIDCDRFSALAEQRHAGQTNTLPVEVRREIERIERADLVVFQFPLWWHAQPAILKGWLDRVFASGTIYTSRMRYDAGIFKGKRTLLSVTTGAPEPAFAPGGRGGDIDLLLWQMHYSLHYVGFTVLEPFLTFGVAGHGYSYETDAGQRARLAAHLMAWRERLVHLGDEAPLRFHGWGDWDEDGAPRPTRSL